MNQPVRLLIPMYCLVLFLTPDSVTTHLNAHSNIQVRLRKYILFLYFFHEMGHSWWVSLNLVILVYFYDKNLHVNVYYAIQ